MDKLTINNSINFNGSILRSSHNNEGGEPLWLVPSKEQEVDSVTLVNFELVDGKLVFIHR